MASSYFLEPAVLNAGIFLQQGVDPCCILEVEMTITRTEFTRFHNGEKAEHQFSGAEHDARLKGLIPTAPRFDSRGFPRAA